MRYWIAVWVGSVLICRRAAAWLHVSPWLKLSCCAGLLLFVNGAGALGESTGALAALWLAAALWYGLRTPATAPEAAPEQLLGDHDQAPEAAPGITREQLHDALRAVANPHAHTSAVATHLGTTPEAVRAALTTHHIPTRPVRAGGRVSTGVHQTAIPPAETAPDAGVAGGVTSNNNSNNNAAFTVAPDPARPHRHLVHWKAPADGNP